ncbi:MAG TPA: formylglycine-generating enzyme family protein [Bryobacteraceae bacterium]|nr:formylglycine-generating enzyme family protein [Bryobacteraceae bacterium]
MRFATWSAVAALALAGVFLLAQNSAPTKNSIGMEFVKIAPGEFVMGCSTDNADCNDDEKPAHRVQITKSFEIGKYEVTQAQWQAIVGSNPSANKGDNRPVETVSKGEVHEFLNRLNARNDGYKYRLPNEAEWEYAAKAGSPEPTGAALEEFAWYAANSGDETHPVGQKKPNAWGLYDMLGNVREWVEDQYSANYYANSPLADPTGPTPGQDGGRGRDFGRGRGRGVLEQQPDPQRGRGFGRGGFGRGFRQLPVVRGGAWDNPASFVRLSARYHYYGPTLRVSDIGFRAVREPAASQGGAI